MKRTVKSLIVMAAAVVLTSQANANPRGFELGIGAGTTHAIAPKDFKDPAKTGDAVQYWLGYGFTENWGAELGYDVFDFDGASPVAGSKHKQITASGVYRFIPANFIHPIAKLGVAAHESKADGEKVTGLAAKAALGLEADFQYISVGALFNYVFAQKIYPETNLVEEFKNGQVLIPTVFLTIHPALSSVKKSESLAPAPVAFQAAAAIDAKDTDGDGIIDADDKCPNTAAGIKVNGYGCALTETASIKLEVEFASGKSDLDAAKYATAIQNLADFMAKYPETKVEIAGHTDSTGSEAANNTISLARATSVKDALVKAGVNPSRVTAKGYGPSKPVADNKTAAGRQANRRVMAEIAVNTEVKK